MSKKPNVAEILRELTKKINEKEAAIEAARTKATEKANKELDDYKDNTCKTKKASRVAFNLPDQEEPASDTPNTTQSPINAEIKNPYASNTATSPSEIIKNPSANDKKHTSKSFMTV